MSTLPVFRSLDLSLSDRCNLVCSFCYTRGGCGKDFDQTHIDRCFDWFFKQFIAGATEYDKKRGVRINIYGGEPLVEWEHLKAVILEKSAVAHGLGIRIRFGIITNMTLLTDEKLDWLDAHDVSISPSIDGCQPAQDSERKFRDGTGSSSVVYDNAKRLLVKYPNSSCRMTVSPSTVQHTYESILFLTKGLGFKTVNAVMAGGVNWDDEKLEIFKQQIEKVTDWWIDEMRQGRFWDLYHIRNMMLGFWSKRRSRELCYAGITNIAIDTYGNMYPCHRFGTLTSKPEYKLGDLDSGITNNSLRETLKGYNISGENKERCKDCPANVSCHALCINEMMLAGKGMFEPCEHICKIWPFYWKMAMRAHNVLTAENNPLYLEKFANQTRQNKNVVATSERGCLLGVEPSVLKVESIGGKINFEFDYKLLFENGCAEKLDRIVLTDGVLLRFCSACKEEIIGVLIGLERILKDGPITINKNGLEVGLGIRGDEIGSRRRLPKSLNIKLLLNKISDIVMSLE